jgi:2-keto-4-pentenoate hydratase
LGVGALALNETTSVSIAEAFVTARQTARSLDRFPGEIPASLAAAYKIQDSAIALCGDPIGGWKVGRIAAGLEHVVGADRLSGPIFARNIWRASNAPVPLPVIAGGFAAAEAEIALQIGVDVPGVARTWTLDDVDAVISSARSAIEFAGSPLATINDLGPLVVISDFGNNAGLILGPEIPNWRESLSVLECATDINGREAGRAKAGPPKSGAMESVRFLLENLGARAIAVPAGTWVCTGAITGIHDIKAQDRAVCFFGDDIAIAAVAVAASASVKS